MDNPEFGTADAVVGGLHIDAKFAGPPREGNAQLEVYAAGYANLINTELLEALDELTAVIGLTAIKHAGQRDVLQKSYNKARAAVRKAQGN